MEMKTVLSIRVSSYYFTRNCNDNTEQNLLRAAPRTASGDKLGRAHQGQGATATTPARTTKCSS